MSRLSVVLLVLAAGSGAGSASAGTDDRTAFEIVAEVLSRRCLGCHGERVTKGDLSLVTRRGLIEGGFVEPGDAEASHLLDVLTTDDRRARMPKDADPLSAAEVDAFRRWIADGAKWPDGLRLAPPAIADLDWWSLRPIVPPPIPEGDAANPVDRFVDARIVSAGLVAVDRADARTLIRRVTYDLTGLPPTPDEIDAFLAANERDPEAAWGELVDRLLASPAFGEKFGQHWLDVARYAETHGYDKDKLRPNAWPYRDWVIRSLNDDVPAARFVAAQIAGDELFPDDPGGVVATGFLAAGPWDFIGHVEVGEGKLDGRIAKHLDRDEMATAVFNTFLSTTVQCAQCHEHKFDPVRSFDYYRLHGTFAAIDRADRVYTTDPAHEDERRTLLAEIAEFEAERRRVDGDTDPALAEQLTATTSKLTVIKRRYADPAAPQYGYHSRIEAKPDTVKWVQVDLGEPRRFTSVRLTASFDRYNDIGPGFGFPTRFRVEASNDGTFANDTTMLLDATKADHPNPGTTPVVATIEPVTARYVRVTATRLAPRTNDWILALGELEVLADGENLARRAKVTSLDSIQAAPRWGRANLVDGIAYRSPLDPELGKEYRTLVERRADLDRRVRPPALRAKLAAIDAELKRRRDRLAKLPKGRMVFAAATAFSPQGQFRPTNGKPRTIHALHRGDLRSPLEIVTPGAPPLWAGAPADFDPARPRTSLARYVTHRDNPLLWRSLANRLVQWSLGKPLVRTPNDFGRMGAKPTHPKLLDHLAARLRDDPRGSIKAIVRLLVTSEAYRRSSRHVAANAERDAGNALLWRAERRRLTAEEWRDSILALAGRLRTEPRGGPSFRDFVLEKPQHSPHYEYSKHDPNDTATHRRSVYRFVVRSQPQPTLTTLDCADPSISVPRRDESTTALQALAQWNNRFVEAMAVQFGGRITGAEGETLDDACRRAWGRPPDDDERVVLERLLAKHGPLTVARVLVNASAFTYLD